MKCLNKSSALRGFSALHAAEPIAGLRSSGKGANRTILDCLFRLIGRNKAVFLPPRGSRAPAASFRLRHVRCLGRFHRLQLRKGLEIVTTASSAEHPTRRDFLFVATGAAAAVGGLATLWPFVSQMNPDASTIAAGAPIEVDLTPIADGQDIKVFWRGKPIYIMHRTKKQIEEARAVPVSSLPRSGNRPVPGQGGPRPVAGRDRHLHPSRLHPDRA